MMDWQTLLVTLFILAAAFYVARRAYARLRSFRSGRRTAASTCEAGCGCGGTAKQSGTPRKVTIQSRSG